MTKRKRQALEPEPEHPGALQLVECQSNGTFALPPTARQFLMEELPADGRLAVIVVAGPYRTGKSYLLNRLAGREEFVVDGSVNACTKGLWVSRTLLHAEGVLHEPPLRALLIDTEGAHSLVSDATRDANIVVLAMLMASLFVYNTNSTINESSLSQLDLVANLTQRIRVSDEDTGDLLPQYLPQFLWVLRDFTLELVDETQHRGPITSDQYLERALQGGTGDVDRIQQSLRTLFPQRGCCTVAPPGAGTLFEQHMNDVRRRILQHMPEKQVNGRTLTGPVFCHLLETHIHALNNGATPRIRDAWTLVSETQRHDALKAALETWDRRCDTLEKRMLQKVQDEHPLPKACAAGGIPGPKTAPSENWGMAAEMVERSLGKWREAARKAFIYAYPGEEPTTVDSLLGEQLHRKEERVRRLHQERVSRVLSALVDRFAMYAESSTPAPSVLQEAWANASQALEQHYGSEVRPTLCERVHDTLWRLMGRTGDAEHDLLQRAQEAEQRLERHKASADQEYAALMERWQQTQEQLTTALEEAAAPATMGPTEEEQTQLLEDHRVALEKSYADAMDDLRQALAQAQRDQIETQRLYDVAQAELEAEKGTARALEEKQQGVTHMEQELTATKEELRTARAALQDTERQRRVTQQRTQALEEDCAELNAERDRAEQRYTSLQRKSDQDRREIQGKLQDAQRALQTLQQRLTERDEDVRASQSLLASAQKNEHEAHAQCHHLRQMLRTQREDAAAQCARARTEKEEARTECRTTQAQLVQTRKAAAFQEAQVTAKQDVIASIREDAQRQQQLHTKERDDLQKQVAAAEHWRRECEDVRAELALLRQRYEALCQEQMEAARARTALPATTPRGDHSDSE